MTPSRLLPISVLLATTLCAVTPPGHSALAQDRQEDPTVEPATVSSVKPGDKAPSFALKAINPELCRATMFSLQQHVGGAAKIPARALVLTFGLRIVSMAPL